ncbi:MAG: YqeG family HAD IIIA-type phosphatase [Oscillospiraceae bacterium]|nr:YqeG family HAD IIIA-type phosphatase [Oscillospiraceae bacterium]MBQ3500811.1 YqeG family HAD IIIA-type phosphatase [Oscillospiraceae bacterium]
MSLLKPHYRFNRITDIAAEDLISAGVKIVLLDADNTLSFHGSKKPFPGVPEWIAEIKECGIVPVIISNNSERRIKPFAKKLGLDYVSKSAKPLSKGFKTALEKYGFEPKDSAVIGDQLFTDVLGGNLLGAKVFLTEPLGPETDRFIKIKRIFEKPLR